MGRYSRVANVELSAYIRVPRRQMRCSKVGGYLRRSLKLEGFVEVRGHGNRWYSVTFSSQSTYDRVFPASSPRNFRHYVGFTNIDAPLLFREDEEQAARLIQMNKRKEAEQTKLSYTSFGPNCSISLGPHHTSPINEYSDIQLQSPNENKQFQKSFSDLPAGEIKFPPNFMT